MFRTLLRFAAAGALVSSPVVAQNLVSNGSFENPALAAGTSFTTILNGGTVGAWSITNGSVDLIRSYWAPADGFQSLDLNGNSQGTISQALATAAGTRYTLTFSMAGNPDWALDKVMRVWWGSQDLGLQTFVQTGQTRSNIGWMTVTFSDLLALSGTTALSFEGVNGGPTGMALDNIVVTANVVPEPSTAVLFATGSALLLVVAYRRRVAQRALKTARV
jgi:choice-of-anchor C domain-containing protein